MFFPFGDDVPARRRPVVTGTLIAINVLALLAIEFKPAGARQWFVIEHGFVPARLAQLIGGRPLVVDVEVLARQPHLALPVVVHKRVELPADRRQIVTTLLTSLFLHGGWLHLLGNMWFLWIFGDNVEDRLGHVGFALFYLAGGTLANLCHWLSDPQSGVPVIGASGAVATVLGAYAITWPLAHVRCLVVLIIFVTVVDLPALAVLGFWFVTQVLEASHQFRLGIQGGVAFWAHIGGFLAGMAAMPWLARPPAPPPRPAPPAWPPDEW